LRSLDRVQGVDRGPGAGEAGPGVLDELVAIRRGGAAVDQDVEQIVGQRARVIFLSWLPQCAAWVPGGSLDSGCRCCTIVLVIALRPPDVRRDPRSSIERSIERSAVAMTGAPPPPPARR
jgi:hypothetical protein